MKLKDVIKTEQEIRDMGHSIENNIIEKVDVNIIAHFGNCTCFEIMCSDVCAMGVHNNTQHLGYIIKAFIELFDLSEEDGIKLSEIKNVPCRIISEGQGGWGSRCVGFGHFMKNKFVLVDDFAKIDEW